MRALYASTRGAGHYHPLVPFLEACRAQRVAAGMRALPPVDDALAA